MAEILQPDEFGWWVTGLVDGEGCFYAGLSFRSKKTAAGNSVPCVNLQAELAVALRADDEQVLGKLKSYFGCGVVGNKTSNANAPSRRRQGIHPSPMRSFKIRAISDLVSVVIPHFEKYPLQSKKLRDFEVWRSVVEFAAAELTGHKGWLRRFPEKVETLQELCVDLKNIRKYDPALARADRS